MNTSKQALTIEECKELKALGFDMSDASMIYVQDPFFGGMNLQVNHGQYEPGDCYTYTLQDLLEKLPDFIPGPSERDWVYDLEICNGRGLEWEMGYSYGSDEICFFTNNSPLSCAFEMLKWCKENKYI